jgi:hypothetical protein
VWTGNNHGNTWSKLSTTTTSLTIDTATGTINPSTSTLEHNACTVITVAPCNDGVSLQWMVIAEPANRKFHLCSNRILLMMLRASTLTGNAYRNTTATPVGLVIDAATGVLKYAYC